MSDLDKLMKKLKTDDPKADDPTPVAQAPAPVVAQAPAPVVAQAPAPVVAPAIDDDDEDDDEEEESEVIAEGGQIHKSLLRMRNILLRQKLEFCKTMGSFGESCFWLKKSRLMCLKSLHKHSLILRQS